VNDLVLEQKRKAVVDRDQKQIKSPRRRRPPTEKAETLLAERSVT
jgi:hypothetical protein